MCFLFTLNCYRAISKTLWRWIRHLNLTVLCLLPPRSVKRYAVKAAYENTWAWREGICVGLESNPGRSGIRSGNPELSTVCLCLALCLVSVIWTCAWIDAVPSEVAMSPTWLTRIASLLLAFHLRYVRSAMCPRQMATSRFLPLWKAPRKDPLRNVSINGIDLFHEETTAKYLEAQSGPIRPNRCLVSFLFLFLFLSAFLAEAITSIAQHSHCSCFWSRKVPSRGFPHSPGLTTNLLQRKLSKK